MMFLSLHALEFQIGNMLDLAVLSELHIRQKDLQNLNMKQTLPIISF